MEQIKKAKKEVEELYQQTLGKAPPSLTAASYLPFPPGVDPVHHAMLELQQLQQLTQQLSGTTPTVSWTPLADVCAGEDAWIVRLETPGVSREDLKVFVAGGECVVQGERKPPLGEVGLRPLRMERPWGFFERRFALPPGSKFDAVKARYQEGILEVRVPVTAGTVGGCKIDVD